jgi:hypothetical protein
MVDLDAFDLLDDFVRLRIDQVDVVACGVGLNNPNLLGSSRQGQG